MIRDRFKASISKGNPPEGIIKCVVSFKDNGGGRWEYVGMLPKAAVYLIMPICVSNGKLKCYAEGQDAGIESAFGALAAKPLEAS